ncbi:helix-turn-helix domain-containing protein [Formosa algae]|uniref:Tic20 family protein n=1 Tax=Formosa algae TaxID=225843 RepID=A0A9X0YIB5_9FLAO|nr:helix-turn-helix domain-containing protein [Formosa algae]MBP1838870.1 putative Tic20 family protein [Formosa algae]MDQ0333647.1 putative Tic20 family protein [Formosa algae]OEI78837.1 DNA-binding protein [Formosa algae]
MNEIGKKIRDVRKKKGLSQEELAESAKINLRTIQRIENNESEPRGKTLNLICKVLDLNAEDILDYGKKTDKSYLTYFHLSVLLGLIIPIGNIVIPFILWITKKDKIIDLKDMGANLLNFQIIWTLLAFFGLIIGAFLKITHLEIGPGNLILSLYFWLFLYVINIILPIIFAIKVNKGQTGNFYPNIIKLIK